MTRFRPTIDPASSSPWTHQWRMAAWTTYTPAWTTSGTQPSIGNGILTGRYRRDGTTLHLQVRLDIGSTSTLGTGVVRLGLPTGMSGSPMQQVGAAFWYDASAGAVQRGVSIIDPAGTYIYPWLNDSGTASNSNGLATDDAIACGGTFEIAP